MKKGKAECDDKTQRVILSAAACLLLGLGIGLNGCGQKGDLVKENSVESQMGEVQQGVEQNTDNAKQFHGNSGALKRENGHAHRNMHASDQNLQNGGQGRNGQLQTSEWQRASTWIGSGSVAESGRVTENVRATESGRSGSLLGGGSGSVTYQVKTVQENFHAEDGTVLYQLQLSWPYFAGKAGGVLQVNRFYEDWKNEKLRIYEADGDSIRQAALEIYRESKDSGWTGSWTERYRVSRVCTKGQYVSVLLDSDLKEGNLKKIPHRESYVLDLESGQQVTLEKLLGKSREECYQLLQEAYRDKLRENPGVYYADAEEKIAALNPEKIGWYFTETAIVCYLEPYTIALPEEGYVEAELPIEDDRE
ncbi:RsiV family protein [Gallintestinimicrobium sp.]|uniref:RsiV family protein n=1 Tax=Gallintestinimicrobium sp. TaxID=2981655 RepID=UPI0039954FF2